MQRYMRGMGTSGFVQSHDEPLSDAAIRERVPAVFAEDKHESRSERFTYIPTYQVLNGLRREGFQPFLAAQGGSRVPGKANYTKHLVRLRHESRTNLAGEAHELVLLNAHDGTATYQLFSGVIKFLCLNGLMTGDIFEKVKVRHTGDAVDQVIEGAYTVLNQAPEVMASVDNMKAITLNPEERNVFARAVHQLRFEDQEFTPDPEQLLRPRRSPDREIERSLWGTFNIAQENAMRGGLDFRRRVEREDGTIQHRRDSSRPVRSVDGTTSLNRAMWTLAEEMARLKAAA